MINSTFVKRVVLRNYKSIAACDVNLGPLVFLVGPNGAGKSNFVDALRFVADGLRTSLDHAFRDRGGFKEVCCHSIDNPSDFAIRLEFRLDSGEEGHYAFEIGARPHAGYQVLKEECKFKDPKSGNESYFSVSDGTVRTSVTVAPAAPVDRLYLVSASGLPEFRPVYEAFSRMGFYNLNPEVIRAPQSPGTGELLARDGSNITSVIRQLEQHNPAAKERVEAYLGKILSGVEAIEVMTIGPKETFEVKQAAAGVHDPWRFLAANMSDGTLHALGILVALFQSSNGIHSRVPLVGIEEPELALHPAAAGVLLDSLKDASHQTQIIATSHSPDLLDDESLEPDSILAVVSEEGTTKIGLTDDAGRTALRNHLYTAGELLRLDQLAPDPAAFLDATGHQLRIFDDGVA